MNGSDQIWGDPHLGFLWVAGKQLTSPAAAWGCMSTAFRCLPMVMEAMTRGSGVRQSRRCGQIGRFRPAEEERYCRRWRRRQSSSMPSIRGIPRAMEALGRCAKMRGGLGYQKEVAGSPVAAGIKKNCGGYAKLRRAISPHPGIDFLRKWRGKREESGRKWGASSRAVGVPRGVGERSGNAPDMRVPLVRGREGKTGSG
jgi:hypothetical protein